MSQQACLPVSRQRRRKRNNQGHEAEAEEEPNFQEIGTMDANEYLRRVVSEAGRLPDVFMAQNDSENRERSHHIGGQFDDGEDDDDETMNTDVRERNTQQQHNSLSKTENKRGSKRGSALNKENDPSFFVSGSAAAANYLVSNQTELVPPPRASAVWWDGVKRNPYVPALGRLWADRTLDAFSRLRLYLEQVHAESDAQTKRPIVLPPLKDRAGWHVFCVGKQEAEGNTGSYYGDDDDDNNVDDDNFEEDLGDEVKRTMKTTDEAGGADKKKDAQNSDDDLPAWERGLLDNTNDGYYSPTTSLLLQMDQVMVRRVLSHLTYFVCEGWSVTKMRAAWLYALAARLDRSIHRDDAVILYQLLKRLTVLRASISISESATVEEGENMNEVQKETVDTLACINTLILIFGVYFEQGGGYTSLMEPKP